MVQRKAAQKAKVPQKEKAAPASAAKPEKKALSNGLGKVKPKAKSSKKPAVKPEPANDISFSDEKKDIETASSSNQVVPDQPNNSPENNLQDKISEKITDSKETITSNKAKSNKKENPGPSKASSEDNAKVAKPKEMAPSAEGNPRKRKAADEKAPGPKKETSKKSTLSNKAKKQKIVLEVPSLSSFIPGKVFVVGENDCGQLGLDKDIDLKEKPSLLNLPYSIIDIAAGGMHSACLTESGEVITFGCNDEGALGRVTPDEEEHIPRKVDIPEKIVQISAGDSHCAGLAESGQVYIWGNFRNGEGQMGLTPNGQKQIAPTKVLTGKTIVKIASGGDHFACLSDEGILYTCGCGEQGQLGRINPRSSKNGGRQRGLAALLEPDAVVLKPKKMIDDVWTESYATFVKVQETGFIYAFGLNNYNQLGLENANDDQESQTVFFPLRVSSFNNKTWKQINGGQHHTLALDSDGLVHALGRKEYGRLGLGEGCEHTRTPTAIPTLEATKCNSVSCGNTVSYAVTEEGSLYSWGMESSQLGHGSQGNSSDIHVPRIMKGELLNSWEVLKVSGGGQHALILARPKQGSSKGESA